MGSFGAPFFVYAHRVANFTLSNGSGNLYYEHANLRENLSDSQITRCIFNGTGRHSDDLPHIFAGDSAEFLRFIFKIENLKGTVAKITFRNTVFVVEDNTLIEACVFINCCLVLGRRCIVDNCFFLGGFNPHLYQDSI